MYTLFPTKAFLRKAKKLIDSAQKRQNLEESLIKLETNPFYSTLKTHKVQSGKYGLMYSSRVTGDLRIIWNFDQDDKLILLLLDLGGHEGGNKVYK